jgi:hypothetical protein
MTSAGAKASGNTRKDVRRLLLQALARLFGTDCVRCGKPVDITAPSVWPDGPTLDHVEAVALAGSPELDNVRLAHMSCNSFHGGTVSSGGRRWALPASHHRPIPRPAPGQEPLF